MIRRIFRPNLKFVALAAATLTVAAVACSDFTGVPSSLTTITDSGTVSALNGAFPGAPTAFHVFSGTLLSADANFTFDVAFDIDAKGNVVVLPQRAVATGLSTTHTVALQTVTGSFDSIDRAPKSGYRADTATVVAVNQVVIVQSQDATICNVSLTGTTLYAKVLIESVDPVARLIKVKFTVDPNCGFFSFVSGLPKD
jgi:hypothetical protein